MKKNNRIYKMTGMAILTALTVVLTLISNYIVIGGSVSINLSLIPIVIAAIVYGPVEGMLMGFVNGAIVMTAPATISGFFSVNPFGTIVTCLLKTGIAGLAAGGVYRGLRKLSFPVAIILASIVTPIVNTALFIVGCLVFFSGVFADLISIFVGLNFLIEFGIDIVLSPTLVYVVKVLDRQYDLGIHFEKQNIEAK